MSVYKREIVSRVLDALSEAGELPEHSPDRFARLARTVAASIEIPEPPTQALDEIVIVTMAGRNVFPIDVLRRMQAVPRSSLDSARIKDSTGPDYMAILRRDRRAVLQIQLVCKTRNVNYELVKSYGWTIESVASVTP